MCGIAGIASITRAPERGDLIRMLDTIVHRGPDDQGAHVDTRVAIGMRRLSIIDVAGGHQPIANEDETVWVVCNGEIYNFERLRSELVAKGHRFRTRSDTEVVVHAYEQYGLDFLDHIEGMFGLAVWDSLRQRLVVARDRLGIKPVYYHHSSRGDLMFASEVKALLASGRFQPALDEEALQDYLALGYAVAPRTAFKGISKLAPGECLLWENGSARRRRYWKLRDEIDSSRSEQDWRELIRSELERVTADHLVSDVPLGSFLSGGIDSSSIVALMSQASAAAPVNTYAIGYEGDTVAQYYNELPYARQVADYYRTNHRQILVQPDVAELLPKLMWHLEEPICDTATLTTYLVSRLAADSVTVIMSGVGGDELFGGYRRYLGHHYAARYRRIPSWVRDRVIGPIAELLPSGRGNRLQDLARYARQFVRSDRMSWSEQYRTYVELQAPDVRAGLCPLFGPLPDGFDTVTQGVTAKDPLLRLLQVDIQTQLPEALLLLSDKMTMAASLECRVPFLDHRLVELAASIPAHIKVRRGHLKHLLKLSVADILPERVITRRKRGFGAPMGSWMQTRLAPLRNTLLSRHVIEGRGILSWRAVEHLCRAHDARQEDYTDVLMVLMNLEIWNRVFIDGDAPADVSAELVDQLKAA